MADEYFHSGGYPEVINNRDIAVNYLSSLFDSIISKDITARGYEISPNLGRHLENLVFIELLRRGYVPGRSLFYYHTRYDDKEVDFVCRAGTKVTEIIQVCYEISTIGTLTRETAALDRASGELGCDSLKIIVWNEPSVTVDSRYNVIRFSDWALEYITETH